MVIATGGFGGNAELLARHMGPSAHSMLLRANPRSTGDGLLAAIAAGGRSTASMSTFYGHTMPGPPASVPAARWVSVTQYYTQDAILVNSLGERFFDESRSMADETAAFEIVRQPEGRAWLVMDRRIHDDVPLPGPIAGSRGFRLRQRSGRRRSDCHGGLDRRAGGRTRGAGASIEPGSWRPIDGFDRALAAGSGETLRVPRTRSPFGLVEPPFRALEVRPGITFTLGGIDVDADLRVLDREGRPIPSLFAAGADAGGTYDGGYMGGLVLGLVQGRAAGRSAARAAA